MLAEDRIDILGDNQGAVRRGHQCFAQVVIWQRGPPDVRRRHIKRQLRRNGADQAGLRSTPASRRERA